MEEKRGVGKSLRDAMLAVVGIVLAGMIAKFAALPGRVSVLEADDNTTKAAVVDIQNNVRTILNMLKKQ